MGLRRQGRAPQDVTEALMQKITRLEREVKMLRQAGAMTVQTGDLLNYATPTPFEVILNSRGVHIPATEKSGLVYWHPGDLDHPDGNTPAGWKVVTERRAVLFIKVFGDFKTVIAGDEKFRFLISRDMDGMSLTDCEAYVTTPGANLIQLRKSFTNVDMLSTRITIDSGEYNSMDAAVQPVINEAVAEVAHGDHISIDVDTGGGKGLGVYLTFEFVNA